MTFFEEYGKTLQDAQSVGRPLPGVPNGRIKPYQKNATDLILEEVEKRSKQAGALIRAGRQLVVPIDPLRGATRMDPRIEVLRGVIDAGPTAPGTLDEARKRGWIK